MRRRTQTVEFCECANRRSHQRFVPPSGLKPNEIKALASFKINENTSCQPNRLGYCVSSSRGEEPDEQKKIKMKLTVQNIRKAAGGWKTESQTATFCRCREEGKPCNHAKETFVKIWTNTNSEREALLKDLIAKGIPAKSGHYANEISFFISAI